nr:hypothetical protein Iba_chr12eCG4110 [Ipomoea batatas]
MRVIWLCFTHKKQGINTHMNRSTLMMWLHLFILVELLAIQKVLCSRMKICFTRINKMGQRE